MKGFNGELSEILPNMKSIEEFAISGIKKIRDSLLLMTEQVRRSIIVPLGDLNKTTDTLLIDIID